MFCLSLAAIPEEGTFRCSRSEPRDSFDLRHPAVGLGQSRSRQQRHVKIITQDIRTMLQSTDGWRRPLSASELISPLIYVDFDMVVKTTFSWSELARSGLMPLMKGSAPTASRFSTATV